MRLIFTSIILALLAQPTWAQTVYYCVTTNSVNVTYDGVKSHKEERFKMAVDEQQVQFVGSGMFSSDDIWVVEVVNQDRFSARQVLNFIYENKEKALVTASTAHFDGSKLTFTDL